MKTFNQRGLINALLIPLILVSLLFVAAGAFGVWAYLGRQDYKNNVDQKIAAATEIAKQQTAAVKDNEFVQREKLPLRTYSGPSTYGSITIQYPKTWSAFVDENGASNGAPINGYWYPNFVPGTQSGASFALRLQVTQTTYAQELTQFSELVKAGKTTVSPFKAPRVPDVIGARVDGQLLNNKQGSMVLIPLRDKTLKIWTEAQEFKGDFDGTILPNLTFVP